MEKSALHYLFLTVAGVTAALLPVNILAAPGDLFEADQGSNTIFKFTPAGAKSTFATGLGAPFGLAVDGSGNVFEANFNDGTIFKFSPAGVKSTFASGLNGPIALAFDASGNLFAADSVANVIFKFTPAGVKSTFASGLNMPVALAFDGSGNLFEADHGSNKIFKFTPAGVKTTFASGLSGPFGLAFGAGALFESDTGTGRIIKITGTGVKSTFASGLSTPTGLAFDDSGNLFEADQASGTIFKFTPAGVKSTFASGLSQPSGLAFERPTAQLTNISTRASVQTGQGVTIGGFIVTGTDSKTVVLRGLGPTLGQPPFNVAGVLADPTLQLFDGSGHPLWFNDNWRDTQQAQIQATGHAPPNDLESAILQVLQPGNYTAILAGKNGTTGIGLVEVYDVSPGVFAELTNVSTRGFVGSSQGVMIGGFITGGGNGSIEVVVRGLGPTLAQPPFSLSGTLADPVVTLVDQNGTVVKTNDNWKNTQQAAIEATGLAPPNDLESAMVVTVATGRYTAILSGKNGGTGIGLVEIYKVR
jgi:sugar lactone lactonase YvrE